MTMAKIAIAVCAQVRNHDERLTPDEVKTFVDERVVSGYEATSEYVCDLIRRDRERE